MGTDSTSIADFESFMLVSTGWPASIGMGDRLPSESVAGGRLPSDYAPYDVVFKDARRYTRRGKSGLRGMVVFVITGLLRATPKNSLHRFANFILLADESFAGFTMGKGYRKTWLSYSAEDKRYAAMTGLGFSSGLPFLLVYSTQSAWLSEAGVPIETIGLLSELTIAYKFKFLWSPFLTNTILRS